DLAAWRGEAADRELMFLKDALDGLQIEIRRQVHDGVILVVKALGRRRALAIAADEVLEEIDMRRDVTVEIHRHEAGELQEARIDAAEGAGIARRHRLDDAALEPSGRARGGEVTRLGRVGPRMDRAAQ